MAKPITILHTADWHLGHTLVDVSREAEHHAFLEWLLERIERERPDALVHAGDVFDSSNPPASAQRAWYGFLAEAWRRRPRLQVVAIAGNHDSPARLDAPESLLRAFGGHVVGALPRKASGALDPDRLLVPLLDEDGATAAWCAAVPYLRPSDVLPGLEIGERPPAATPSPEHPAAEAGAATSRDPLVEGVRAVYAEATALLRARRGPGQALLATGHTYMAGASISDLSERKILGGNLHALPSDIFAEDLAYVALGHIHRPQRIAHRENVRYAGSPIPLSFPEAQWRHGVVLARLEGERVVEARTLEAPRSRQLLRLPEEGARPLAEVQARLRALPAREGQPAEALPLVEVRVALAAPEPFLRKKVEEALEGRAARLVGITVETTGAGGALADRAPRQSLETLTPEDVFRRRWERDHAPEAPPRDLIEAFHSVHEAAQDSGGGAS